MCVGAPEMCPALCAFSTFLKVSYISEFYAVSFRGRLWSQAHVGDANDGEERVMSFCSSQGMSYDVKLRKALQGIQCLTQGHVLKPG